MIIPDSVSVVDTVKIINLSPHEQFNYFTLFNIGLLILNTIVTIYLNFFAFRKRKNDDRLYKANFDLYKSLIIDNFNGFLTHCNEVETILISATNTKKTSRNRIQFIESQFEIIEEKQHSFYREVLPFVSTYSKEMYNEIHNAVEKFYDDSEDLLSKIAVPLDHNDSKILQKFSVIKSRYLDTVSTLVKKYQPITKH